MLRRLFHLGLLLFFSLAIFIPSWSQSTVEHLKNQPYLKYRDRINCEEPLTTLDQRVCANLRAQTSDSLLLETYHKVVLALQKHPNEKVLVQLEEAQAHWVKMRNAECGIFWELYEGGSLQPVIYMNCLADRIDGRRLVLEALLAEFEHN